MVSGLRMDLHLRLTMSGHLFLSFWDLCLDNLPQGRFERRVIGAGEAGAIIRAARGTKPYYVSVRTICLRPIGQRSADAMKKLARRCTRATPVRCGPRDRLLVVTCDYQLDR